MPSADPEASANQDAEPPQISTQQQQEEPSDDEESVSSAHTQRKSVRTNHYGIFVTSDRAGLENEVSETDTHTCGLIAIRAWRVNMLNCWHMSRQEEHAKDPERCRKWLNMEQNWSKTVRRHPSRLKRRVRKGIPDAVRGRMWQVTFTCGHRLLCSFTDVLCACAPVVDRN